MKLLTDHELAAHFGLKVATVRKMRLDGEGPAHIIVGKSSVRYRMEDVELYQRTRVTGGYLPPHAISAMRGAAKLLELVGTWKIRDKTRAHALSAAASLRELTDMPQQDKNSVDISDDVSA